MSVPIGEVAQLLVKILALLFSVAMVMMPLHERRERAAPDSGGETGSRGHEP